MNKDQIAADLNRFAGVIEHDDEGVKIDWETAIQILESLRGTQPDPMSGEAPTG